MSEINKDDVNGLNRPVSPNEIQTVIKILPTKITGQMESLQNSIRPSKKS